MLPKFSPTLYLSARSLTTARRLPSTSYTNPPSCAGYEPATQTTPSDLNASQRRILESALRVDQAGEIAANYIYQGQMAVLSHDKRLCSLIQVQFSWITPPSTTQVSIPQDMWEQEKKHLVVMDKLQIQHNVRPTVLTEVAKIAGFGLGAVTALMGKEAAMACTEAVETVIGEHYDK